MQYIFWQISDYLDNNFELSHLSKTLSVCSSLGCSHTVERFDSKYELDAFINIGRIVAQE